MDGGEKQSPERKRFGLIEAVRLRLPVGRLNRSPERKRFGLIEAGTRPKPKRVRTLGLRSGNASASLKLVIAHDATMGSDGLRSGNASASLKHTSRAGVRNRLPESPERKRFGLIEAPPVFNAAVDYGGVSGAETLRPH